MNIVLRAAPEEIRKQSVKMEQNCEKILQELDCVKSESLVMQSFWEGEAAEQNRTQRSQWLEKCQTLAMQLRAYPPQMRTMAGIYEKTEDTAESMANALKSDVI